MRLSAAIVPVFVFLLLGFTAKAAEAPKDGKAATAPAPAGKEETFSGQLGDGSDGRPFLKVKVDGAASAVKSYSLWAEGDLKKQLDALAKKKAKAEVTGVVAPDGVNMKVTAIKELVQAHHGHH
jgi:hypothetical protein